ncbi:hypothetical protein ACFQX7_24830 [Luedemannella flava]
MTDALDLSVKTLGACRIESPFGSLVQNRRSTLHYVDEADLVLFDDTRAMVAARGVQAEELPGFEPGGPRGRSSSTRRRPGSASSPAAGCAPA